MCFLRSCTEFPIKLCEIWLAFAPLVAFSTTRSFTNRFVASTPDISPARIPSVDDSCSRSGNAVPKPCALRAEPPAVERSLGSVQASLIRPVMEPRLPCPHR